MAKLLTHHDPGHIHGILGFIVLLHFALRIALVFAIGDAFPQRSYLDCVLVLLHAALPMVSLILPLPAKRNFNNPMIWPEFRLHSLAFASRHVFGTIFWLDATSSHRQGESVRTTEGLLSMSVVQFVAVLLLVHATMFAATITTNKFGNVERRTTNAMPYDQLMIPELQQRRAKRLYAFAQFMATAFLFVGDPTLAFISLAGIQSAPFLMTLVRKGKCSTATYHCVYAWSLILPLLVLIRISLAAPTSTDDADQIRRNVVGINAALVVGTGAFQLRTSWLRTPKHLVWLITPCVGVVCARFLPIAVAASPLVVPLIGLSSIKISTVLIPHIMLRPTKVMTPFVNRYGAMVVALLYFVGSVTYVVNGILQQRP